MSDKKIGAWRALVAFFPHRQGSRYEDGLVTCRYCNIRFPLDMLEKGIGGCYPIKLEGKLENVRYVIPLSALEAEAGKF